MKNFRFKSVIGLFFALLFILNFYVIIAGLATASHLLIACGILLSCFQLYVLEQFGRKSAILKNLPYHVMIDDFMAFMPLKFRRFIFAKNTARLLLNQKQYQILTKRSKNDLTEIIKDNLLSPDDPGFEYLQGNSALISLQCENFRVVIGSGQCHQPYSLSMLNFGRLSQKQLSKKHVHAISQGANIGNCAVNTGEDGLSPHLIRGGADLIWHMRYNDASFRNDDRSLNELMVSTIALKPYIKMIEVKFQLEDLPATKRGLTAFAISSFVKKLRALSEGKPIGIHLLHPGTDLLNFLGKTMTATGVYFDFITIENLINGMPVLQNSGIFQQPFLEAIVSARKMVNQYQLPTKIIAAGVIVTEYELLRAIALGADACFNASDTLIVTRSATDSLKMNRDAQSIRIANFHRNTIAAACSLMGLCRYKKLTDINPADFCRKVNGLETKTLKELMYQTDSAVVRPLYVNLN
ncbi:hypothetical protein [Mucilaginibacter sp. FT3.2]|uniref:hypothetical protein n=1 Tax=Mucilaginibacter sp. FT3.2 TaxID=2723090 RepID=UPI0016227805|nr:hypothetical protein [Mucilaginibacter sp. FT3.2]MBB6232801.1 hypothetical protein [Mucilaginibacter sp. FT3.2]